MNVPSPLTWLVELLTDLISRGFVGDVTISLKPGAVPIVRLKPGEGRFRG